MNTQRYRCEEVKSEGEYAVGALGLPVPLTQAFWYGVLQEKMGKEVVRVRVSEGDEVVGYAQVVVYKIREKFSFAYAPYGPVLTRHDAALYEALSHFVRSYVSEPIIFLRLEIPKEHSAHLPRMFSRVPASLYRSSFMQPRVEWEVSLEGSDEEIFERFHKHTRKYIRKAVQDGVRVSIVSESLSDSFDVFASILGETAKRKGFALHQLEYYRQMMNIASARGEGFFAIAYGKDGIPACISFHVIVGKTCHALFGGVARGSDAGAARMLKLESMRYAKERGCTAFSFGGIGPENDPAYKDWKGFSDFKRGFGGRYVYHGELIDRVYFKPAYRLFRIAKRVHSILKRR